MKNLEDKDIEKCHATKNLKSSIDRNQTDIKILLIECKDIIYCKNVSTEEILSMFFEKQKNWGSYKILKKTFKLFNSRYS